MTTPAPCLPLLAAVVALTACAHRPPPGREGGPEMPTGLARFTADRRLVDAKVSPKGTYIAAVVMHGGQRALNFVHLASRKVVSSFNPAGDTTVGRFFWASDERVVIELAEQEGPLAAPVTLGEIYAVDVDGGNGRLIFGYRTGGNSFTHLKVAEPTKAWGRVVDPLPQDDRNILVASRSWHAVGDPQEFLWKVDVVTGVKTQVAIAPLPRAGFFTDAKGELRLATGADEAARLHYFLREEGGWRELTQLRGFTQASHPVAFVGADRTIEMVEPVPGGGFGLFSVSIDTGERKLLAETQVAPPSGFDRDLATNRTVGFESEPDLPEYRILDKEHPIAKVMQGLLAAYPGQHVRLLDQSEDGRLAVAAVYSDRNPGQYLIVDVARLSAETIGSGFPWIVPDQMAEMHAFHINASDGFRIHGYLTLPRGLPPGAKPPLVVLPHGGPHSVRDSWGFDPEVQLLASQGFAVLQVNYRGSGGYGDAFREAGFRRWGDRIVQDLLDATRWVVSKGKVDGGRICAYGGSFGAYAAMQASIVAPDLFQCAAGYAGVYDLTLMERTGDISLSAVGRAGVRAAVGEEEADLKAVSPAHNAAKLIKPVFLVHGGRDKRAPIVHAEKLRDALTELGRAPEWLEESAEGHGFFQEAARERFYGRLVAFLKKHTAPSLSRK